MINYPDLNPIFEYAFKITPQIFQSTKYTFEIEYEIKDRNEEANYEVKFKSDLTDLPEGGKLILSLNGVLGESGFIYFSKTEKDYTENKFKFSCKYIGEVILGFYFIFLFKLITLKY